MLNTTSFSRSLLAAALFAACSVNAAPWVYRGSLSDGGLEANGAYDLRVSLVDANGVLLAQPVMLYAVKVQKGSFQTDVDFGLDLARFAGAKIKTEVSQGGSGFVQLGEPKAIANPNAATAGICWDTAGNTGVTGASIVGTVDAASPLLTSVTAQNNSTLYIRGSGGVEQDGSTAAGDNSAAWGSSTAAAVGSFTVGRGQTSAGATNSFVFADVAAGAGSISGLPGEFLVRSAGGIAFNQLPGTDDLVVGPRPGGDNDTVIGLYAANGFATSITSDNVDNSMTLRAFRTNSRVSVDAPNGLRVNNGIELAPPSLSFNGPTMRTDGDNLILRGADIAFTTVDGRIGLNRAATANSVEVGGNASKDTAGSWLANSDARIKTNIESIPNALDTLAALRPVTFRYRPEYLADHPSIKDVTYYNVIAQEFKKVFPTAVQGSGEYLTGKNKTPENEILQVDTYPAQIVAIAAIQELNAKLDMARTENAALKARLEALENQLMHTAKR
jgi:Chaperone of endosialidase